MICRATIKPYPWFSALPGEYIISTTGDGGAGGGGGGGGGEVGMTQPTPHSTGGCGEGKIQGMSPIWSQAEVVRSKRRRKNVMSLNNIIFDSTTTEQKMECESIGNEEWSVRERE